MATKRKVRWLRTEEGVVLERGFGKWSRARNVFVLPARKERAYKEHILQTAHNEWYKHGPDHFFSEQTPRLRPSRLKHLLKLRRYWEQVK